MSRFTYSYDDNRDSKEYDRGITELLGTKPGERDNRIIRKILINVINGELTPKQRDVVLMYYFKGIKIADIAEKTGVSPQAVGAMLSRAKLKIYNILKYYTD
ncbi:MAG: sigma-70 region 4 domain-containing protein [Ruminococcus flavefaciens]|nr:sigma-70 region 4 domain-containing protein [Ruminococcus flavefaciens]MCM1228505.1 sigma-70 region 4 domain-containing protein [Ruminococcus flavefaciens]